MIGHTPHRTSNIEAAWKNTHHRQPRSDQLVRRWLQPPVRRQREEVERLGDEEQVQDEFEDLQYVSTLCQ
jgi:hypothetical protein